MFVTQVPSVCNDNRSHYHIENSLPASVQAWRVEQSPVDSLLIARLAGPPLKTEAFFFFAPLTLIRGFSLLSPGPYWT